MTVVYIDSVFLFNMLTDYLMLLCAAHLAGIQLRRVRFLLAAAAGGAYAVAVFLPGCAFLTALPIKAAAGALVALIAYGGERLLLRLTLLFFGVSCAFAGCVLALGLLAGRTPMVSGVFYTQVDGKILLIASAAAYLVLSVIFRSGAKHGGDLVGVSVELAQRRVSLTALCDSGNTLRDPISGRQMLVVWAERLKELWPPEWRSALTVESLAEPVQAMEQLNDKRFRLIPYRSVGVSSGLLLAVRCDCVSVNGVRYPDLLVALSPSEVSDSGGYHALWGGEVKKGAKKRAGKMEAGAQPSSDPVGAAAAGKNHVHRGQRYAAAASFPGDGSKTAGADRRGGRTPDAD